MLVLNAILVAVFAVQRLVELVVSRRHRRALIASGASPVRDPAFAAMVATHVCLLGGSALEPWLLGREFDPRIGWPALGVLLLAQVLRAWVLMTLGRHWNVRIVASSGDEGGDVVTTGPYRFVRHPNYLVIIVETICLPAFHGAWFTFALVQCMHIPVLVGRVRAEEAYLMSLPGYRRAMAEKPRFVPWRVSSSSARDAVSPERR